ncbi:hypothetical protein GCM10010411_75480 [Actinomadura fulvescens]|uniref:Uncharacterized protein n=1 Tax=Actinomadura fulvescens TaxID=46160 RepID=A0ABP6CT26_9ACTN
MLHPEDQPFEARVAEGIRRLVEQGAQAGISPPEIQLMMTVTSMTDEQLVVVRGLAGAAGLTTMVLVDDGAHPRPGTVRSSALEPRLLAGMDQVAAARTEGDAHGRQL